MPLRKIFDYMETATSRVKSAARLDAGAPLQFGDESGDEVSVRLDASRSPSELVVEDENNNSERLRIPINGGDVRIDGLASTLQAGGVNDYDPRTDIAAGEAQELDVTGLNGSLADRQDPTAHASDHAQGGRDEILAEDLAAETTDTALALSPDGNGGAQWAEASGVAKENSQNYLVRTTSFGDVPLDAWPGGGA